jgi:hypothetical protein
MSAQICAARSCQLPPETFPRSPNLAESASCSARTRRAIDFHEGARINGSALKTLVRDAVA